MDASPEARWLAERLSVAGYVVLVVLASFGGWGVTRSYAFACLPEPRGGRNLLVAAYSGGGEGEGEKGSWHKL